MDILLLLQQYYGYNFLSLFLDVTTTYTYDANAPITRERIVKQSKNEHRKKINYWLYKILENCSCSCFEFRSYTIKKKPE